MLADRLDNDTNGKARSLSTLLIASTLAASWLGMQAVHELGHVLGALLTGGGVERVVLHPLAISRTDVSPNPQPLVVVWAGPLLGVLLPLAAWLIADWRKWTAAFVVRFFAGFCLVANGAYIGVGSFWSVGDCGVMLDHGSAEWQLWLFGLITIPAGLMLWNGQARHFGVGRDEQPVSPRIAWSVCGIAIALTILGVALGD